MIFFPVIEGAGSFAIGTDYIIELAKTVWLICWVYTSLGVFLYLRAEIMGTLT